jgi:hypothetical protein
MSINAKKKLTPLDPLSALVRNATDKSADVAVRAWLRALVEHGASESSSRDADKRKKEPASHPVAERCPHHDGRRLR